MRSPSLLTKTLPGLATATFVVVLGVGCSSSSEKDEAAPAASWLTAPALSGTRLRAKVITGGGARELIGFHDTQRNEDCSFQKAEGERVRCLPPTLIASQTGVFSDPACQIPLTTTTVGSVPGACTTTTTPGAEAKYAIVYRYDSTCGAQSTAEIRKVLPTNPTAARYVQGPTGCTIQPASSPPINPNVNVVAGTLGEVVPWTEFAEATETIVRKSDDATLAEKVLVTSDGARQHLAFRLEKLDADCGFEVMSDGITRCIPTKVSVGSVLYTDSACTTAGFVNDNRSSGPGGPCVRNDNLNEKLWIEPKGAVCEGIKAVYSLSDSVVSSSSSSADLFRWSSSSSSSTTTDPTTRSCTEVRVGSGGFGNQRPIEADLTPSLPKTTRVSGGSGRLVPALVSAGGGTENLTPGFHDNERDVDCTFTLASDGKMRCLPTASLATVFNTDSACKSPTVVAVLNTPPCVAGARFARVVVNNSCPPMTRVFSLSTTARDLQNASTQASPTSCPIFPAVKNAFDATPVDVSGFVEGVLATE